MTRRLSASEVNLAPPSFAPVENSDNYLTYKCELITPMAGGGTKSWMPDRINPVRSQDVKGQLRFWWRTMTNFPDSTSLKKREDEVWGSTDTAGKIRLKTQLDSKLTPDDLVNIEENDRGILQFADANLPAYVLFPLQGQKDLHTYRLINKLKFTLTISISDTTVKAEIENAVKLWLLFGGLGARTRRGCGSIYCPEVMREFQGVNELAAFVEKINKDDPAASHSSPFPVLANCTLATKQCPTTSDPAKEWRSFLDSYGQFRQGPGIGRNPVRNRRPGRTRWPEADAIRRITGNANSQHKPVHPAGNWFPRGAYGMPVQSEFKNAPGDPSGKFFLQPKGKERWPSPVFLKVIKLNDTTTLRVCLILNHAVPESELTGDNLKPHPLSESEAPLAFQGKTMPENANMLHSGESPYAALIRHLGLTEVK